MPPSISGGYEFSMRRVVSPQSWRRSVTKYVALLVLAVAGLAVFLQASVKRGYQTATVLEVKKLDTTPQFVGGNPTDAPTHADEFAYEVGLRVECTNYVGRYESAIDFLPSAIAPNKEVDVRVEKHWVYVSLNGDREIKMGIVHHERVHDDSCPAKD
jgi:hypothetical protein